jgi:membrane peptidoglycan carboxypeptidase
MLTKVICCGTAAGRATLTPPRPEAGKTGTDTDFKNAYFTGYVPQIATSVWVGYAKYQNKSIAGDHGRAGFGADAAAPIWQQVMEVATQNLPVEQFPRPPAPKNGTVPSIVGLQKQAAIDALVKATFTPNPVDGPCLQPKGVVCDQTPAAGAIAPLGTAVTFTVSNGQIPVSAVPDVVGMTRADASSSVKTAGFKVATQTQIVNDPKQDGIVLSQSPKGGTQAPQGSTVTIVVGKLTGPPTPAPTTAAPAGGTARGAGAAGGWIVGPWLLLPAGAAAALRGRRGRRAGRTA